MKKIYTLLSLLFFTAFSFSQDCDFSDYSPPAIFDTYHEVAENPEEWAGYNVHDPSVIKEGDWYYLYNTDVAFGGYDIGTGTMVRRSKDLINWEFLGTAFDGVPQTAVDYFLEHNPDYTDMGIWAPFIMKHNDEFRLYYSAPGVGIGGNLGFIGYATSSSPEGPWDDQGHIVSSVDGDDVNAIDPSVIIDQETGEHWMVYGSYQTGMYIIKLDPETGGALTPDDKGKKIAARSGGRHGSIEGPEITYRDGWYYLFVSYDWLHDFYNLRVGRSRNPDGPYYDINGLDMSTYTDNSPMVVAPYRFDHHMGWQGTGHNAIYNDDGDYYIFHQGRPSTSDYCMVLHTRKVHWIDDWPVVAPQRYAAVPECPVTDDDIVGSWEQILLIYNKDVQHATSSNIVLDKNGNVNGDAQNSWSLDGNMLTFSWFGGDYIDKTYVEWAWDWELREITLTFTGMNQTGLNMWGKRVEQETIDKVSTIESGATYVIRNHNSNKVLESKNGIDFMGANIVQNSDKGSDAQKWVVESNSGYYTLTPWSSASGRYIEVHNGSSQDGANIRLGDYNISDANLFDFEYLDNGYFGILSKSSGSNKGLDVINFSTNDGASVIQWAFSETSNNQLWRFEKVADAPTRVASLEPALKQINVYPNPLKEGPLNIDLSQLPQNTVEIIISNAAGQVMEHYKGEKMTVYKTKKSLEPGICFVIVKSGDFSEMVKVLVR